MGSLGCFLEQNVISGSWKIGRRKEVPGAITVVVAFSNWRR